MKIAFMHFFTFRLPRGVETLTISLANALAQQGEDVSILTARATHLPLVQPLPEVKVHAFSTFRYYETKTIIPFYAVTLARENYDWIVTFFSDFGEGAALQLLRPFSKPHLALYLTFPYEAASHRYHAYRRWGWDTRADLILADANYTAQKGEEFFHQPVMVLPSGTDPERFKPDPQKKAGMRQKLGFADSDIVLLNVSALEERKGTWRVIEAMPAIIARCPNVRYLIMGDGPHKAYLQSRVVELGLSSHVLFAGTTSDLPPYYNAADIFVMLSDSEAGSIALLEAMASGLPVIVANIGGFDEVVSAEVGYRVSLEPQDSFVDRVTELAQDHEHSQRLGENARKLIKKEYSWDQLAKKMMSILRESK